MNDQLTLGVVGHVDHGKTALVRAMTGIETDRLREEQERGLSIVLGFSYLETTQGLIDLIDVPGHEDFIRAMISGATGIDGIVLIVAADEGIMPQTREHFDIAQILEIERGVIVISKIDIAPADQIAIVEKDIKAFVRGSFLEKAPVIHTSAKTKKGIDSLQRELEKLAKNPITRTQEKNFYLPIDRVFTMHGFGLVVTGTLRGGKMCVNDKVQIMPGGQPATIRALQNHNRTVESIYPGQRVAANLRNIKREEVRRGNTLASPGFLKPTRRIDAELHLLTNHNEKITNNAPVRLLLGTTEAVAKVRLLDQRNLKPGGTSLVQLRCDRDIATHQSERFIIRSYSPMRTIGGGRILDVNAIRHKRFDDSVTSTLEITAEGDPVHILKNWLRESKTNGLSMNSLTNKLELAPDEIASVIDASGAIHISEQRIIDKSIYANLLKEILSSMTDSHKEKPHHRGLTVGNLKNKLNAKPDDDVLRHALNDLLSKGQLQNKNGVLCIFGFDPLADLTSHERALIQELESTFLQFGLSPPPLDSVVGQNSTKRDLCRLLTDNGRLVRLKTYDRSSSFVVHADILENVFQKLENKYPYPNKFAVSDVRDLLGSTRKYVIPLMEHFDATGITTRIKDLRQLRGS